MVDVTGIDPAVILAAAYNRARPQGLGFLHYDPTPMTPLRAAEILLENAGDNSKGVYFDYLMGRVMKITIPLSTLTSTSLNEILYDRDNGFGALASAIDAVR